MFNERLDGCKTKSIPFFKRTDFVEAQLERNQIKIRIEIRFNSFIKFVF